MPRIHRRDLIAFSSIVRREVQPYWVYEIEELYTEEPHNDLDRHIVSKELIGAGYYVLTADPQINVARVASRVSAGGHDVPTDKIISRYDKALSLVHELIPLCDVCHIYDNSLNEPYRIFKKRKEEYWYCPERYLWRKDNIVALTGISNAQRAPLNNHRTQS